MKSLRKVVYISIALVMIYLGLGYFLHLVVFPEKRPDSASYFQPGDTFYSRSEGFLQSVDKHEKGLVYCALMVEPFAAGPPEHIHTKFDEYFELANGELTLVLDGETRILKPGNMVKIPRGVPHQISNHTGDTVYFAGTMAFPEKFAFGLMQIYGIMDQWPQFGKMPQTMFKVLPLQQAGFDSYLAQGPPPGIQKFLGFMLVPMLRLLGYSSWYPEYGIRAEL